MDNIKNIIFDLGNVLLDIDYDKTIHAFEQLGFTDFKAHYSGAEMDTLFKDIEKGMIGEAIFYESLQAVSKQPVTDEQLKNAWNAMLLDFRVESLEYLTKISSRYKLYLLSNTNSIHLAEFEAILKRDTGKTNLAGYFTTAYYSNLVGMRKPDQEIYSFVLADAGLVANETLFIDDLANNIEGAQATGLKTYQLLAGERIEKLPFIAVQ